jgi:hypothetical protein
MEYTIKLTEQQLGYVGAGLAELPFKVAQPIMAAIQVQVDAANAAKTEVKPKTS